MAHCWIVPARILAAGHREIKAVRAAIAGTRSTNVGWRRWIDGHSQGEGIGRWTGDIQLADRWGTKRYRNPSVAATGSPTLPRATASASGRHCPGGPGRRAGCGRPHPSGCARFGETLRHPRTSDSCRPCRPAAPQSRVAFFQRQLLQCRAGRKGLLSSPSTDSRRGVHHLRRPAHGEPSGGQRERTPRAHRCPEDR